MTKNLEDVLGREYAVAIKNEINQLKQSEKLLLGDVLAVVERSDTSLGRPEKDCEHSEKSKYIIV